MNSEIWKQLIDPKVESINLDLDKMGIDSWLREVTLRINDIGDLKESIKALFVINQKIGYVKGSGQCELSSIHLNKLQITINNLLNYKLSLL